MTHTTSNNICLTGSDVKTAPGVALSRKYSRDEIKFKEMGHVTF